MTRNLNKKVWPYSIVFKVNWMDEDPDSDKRLEWIREVLYEDIRNRIFILENDKSVIYYFKEEKDYQWFLWRWV